MLNGETRDPIEPSTRTYPPAETPDSAGTVAQTPAELARAAADLTPSESILVPLSPVAEVAGYEVVRKLGEGGMGAVYLARDQKLNRDVAIKTLRATDARPDVRARFWAEAEVMAAVKHPHVVQVYDLGKDVAVPFMVMEYLAGGALADRLRGGARLPALAAAALLEQIARGVAAAHDLGIVHRDLKPANVLLAADGAPKVADFGLAKRAVNDLTRTQALMGTPYYMAPELAAGRAKFVGPTADVWALGVMLYECVSGARPFEGDSTESLLSQITSSEPVALRARVRGLSRDLDTIAAKCLAKEPELRYATAGELADDLSRLARGEPIHARPVGAVERAVRWARRKPAAASAYGFSVLAVALAVVTFVLFGFWREAERAKRAADQARADAETARDHAIDLKGVAEGALAGETALKKEIERQQAINERVGYGRTVRLAHLLVGGNKKEEARALLDVTHRELRGFEYAWVRKCCDANARTVVRCGAVDDLSSACWDPDGARVLLLDARGAGVWDVQKNRRLRQLTGHTGPVRSAVWDPTGARIATTGEDGAARVWDANTGRLQFEFKEHSGAVESAAWSPDGTMLASVGGGESGEALVWDARTGKRLYRLDGTGRWEHKLVWHPGGAQILSVGAAGGSHVHTLATGARTRLDLLGNATALAASWSPDGAQLAAAGQFGRVVIYGADGRPRLELNGHQEDVYAVGWNPGGTRVVTAGGGASATVRVWDANSGAELLELPGDRFASFSPDGDLLLTRGDDGAVRIFDARPDDAAGGRARPAP